MSDQVSDQAEILAVLCRAPAAAVKDFAEQLLPELGPVEVLHNRTGLVMLPLRETAGGATFYLGEVLLAEAHVRVAETEGYAACLGRDLQHALAAALLDAAYQAGRSRAAIAAFVAAQAAALREADERLLQAVAATRVEMETF